MTILVTGGAGFIGSHVAHALILQGHAVHVLDNFSSGLKENVHKKAFVHKGDITNFAAVESIFNTVRPEAVFHLAAQIDVRKSVTDPIADAQTNILASINLISNYLKSFFSVTLFMYGFNKTKKQYAEKSISK